jgi:hypothetical protein
MASEGTPGEPTKLRDDKADLDMWKHFSSSGSTDKHTMITTVTWLLGFGVAAVTYIVTKLITSQRPPVLKYPGQIAIVSFVGAAIAVLAAYVALLYAGYASRNWARADAVAGDLPPDGKAPAANNAPRLTKLAWHFGRGVDHTRDIPPVFRVFFFAAIAVFVANLALLLWALAILLSFRPDERAVSWTTRDLRRNSLGSLSCVSRIDNSRPDSQIRQRCVAAASALR